jgi:hypothetical protein
MRIPRAIGGRNGRAAKLDRAGGEQKRIDERLQYFVHVFLHGIGL